MNALDLILKKRAGKSLAAEEIIWLVTNYTGGLIPDYQMAAFLMATYFQGLNSKETKALTMALAESGEVIDFNSKEVVDKHSSGGVGDKTTLVLAPLVAAAGLNFAKFSGRGLGFTGGTIDKLESIPGFCTNFNTSQFKKHVLEHGLAIAAQSDKITPADGKIYSLRDVTGTVDNVSLIASSIMAKKIAGGAQAILLDVKAGKGAFMKSKEEAFQLAETMVRLGKDLKRDVVAVVSNMNQPLGMAIGNILEVKEAIQTLQGKGPQDLVFLCVTLGGLLLTLTGKARNIEEGKEIINEVLVKGKGFRKFEEMVIAQGGDASYIHDPELFPQATYVLEVNAPLDGFISSIDAYKIGKIAMDLGAGRKEKNAKIDHTVGVVLNRKVGDKVSKGTKLATVHGNDKNVIKEAATDILQAINISDISVEKEPLIIGCVPPLL